jgi:putative hydrolase of the HAD superfamily
MHGSAAQSLSRFGVGSAASAMARIAAVLFDLYGTLVWPDWELINAGRAALAALAGTEPAALAEQWRRTHPARMRGAHRGLRGDLQCMLAACGLAPTDARLRTLAEHELRTWSRGVHLYPDAIPTLQRLRRSGMRTALVSNASAEAAAAVKSLGLNREVDAALLSCEVGLLKPDPRFLMLALARLGVAPGRGLLVDDVADNLDAARSLGLRTLLVHRHGTPPEPASHPRAANLGALWSLLEFE